MKLSTHHIVILLLIVICGVINYAIFFRGIDTSPSAQANNDVYIKNNLDTELLSATTSPESATTTKITKRKDWKPVSILAFGDTMFDRGVRARMQKGIDPFSSFRELNIIPDYDIKILNLEGPIIEMDRSKCQQKAYNFQFASNTAKMLKKEGFTSVNIANNHTYDCYHDGVDSTLNYLKESNIGIIGKSKLHESYELTTTKNGTRVALLGFDTTIAKINTNMLLSTVRDLASANDVVIITMHSGVEYEERANLEQKTLAHLLIENGADAVIGHHPHVIQNMEVYKGKPIFYSLGNFIFDQIGEKENQGLGVGIKFYPDKSDIMLFPFNIITSVPTFMEMKDANEWCRNYYGVTPFITGEGCSSKL